MGAFTNRWIIDRRRGRKQKIDKLRKRYVAARSDADRNSILTKAQLVSPQMSQEQFLGPIHSK
jgi:hypothetical protein